MSELIDQMKVVQATVFSLYLKAHNYHWNVTGPNFSEYHSFFGSYYDALWDSIDLIAEHTRSLDAYVPGSLSRFAELTKIADETAIITADAMFRNLYRDNEIAIAEYTAAHELAAAEKRYGLINFIEDRLDWHAKMHWQLRSFIVKLAPVEATTETASEE
jgi:starvation-inducible DNA-binding protein